MKICYFLHWVTESVFLLLLNIHWTAETQSLHATMFYVYEAISSSPIPHNSEKKILIWKEIWLKTTIKSPVSLQQCHNQWKTRTPDDCSVSVTLQFSQATAVVLLLYKCWLLCDLHFNCSENESTLWFAVRTAAGQSQQGRHCRCSLLCASVYVDLLSVLSFPHVPC